MNFLQKVLLTSTLTLTVLLLWQSTVTSVQAALCKQECFEHEKWVQFDAQGNFVNARKYDMKVCKVDSWVVAGANKDCVILFTQDTKYQPGIRPILSCLVPGGVGLKDEWVQVAALILAGEKVSEKPRVCKSQDQSGT